MKTSKKRRKNEKKILKMNEKSQKNKLPKKFLFLKKEKKNPKNEKLQQSNYRKNSCFVKKKTKKNTK